MAATISVRFKEWEWPLHRRHIYRGGEAAEKGMHPQHSPPDPPYYQERAYNSVGAPYINFVN